MMLLRELAPAPAPVARILSDAGRPEHMITDEEAKVNHMPGNRPALRARPLVGALGIPALRCYNSKSGRSLSVRDRFQRGP